MSTISPLPDSTVKLLGSPLVITTPVSLVKELLDNSIDAKATSVEIQLSPDTVGKIEVRDNGVGIHSDDYDSLGRHGHTSKLRTFEELKTHGCKTLGFRGEALAAANTLGQVIVTTKTAGDPVGASLQLVGDTGGVARQQKASVPVGTTVRITGLFGRIPVREQVAIRESSKTLDKIRDLLKTYAIARPSLKLMLKVPQHPKQSWSYSPKKTAGVKEAVLQIAGKDAAAHCIEKTLHLDEPDLAEGDRYTFEAYVMDPQADPYKVTKHHYFSVDGRPVSTRKGAMKKILDAYKKAVDTAFVDTLSSGGQKGYFIRLNITCPLGSYDANVDEVLFINETYLLDTLERLWKDIYRRPGGHQLSNPVDTDVCVDLDNNYRVESHTTCPSGRILMSKTNEAHAIASSDPASDTSLLGSCYEAYSQITLPTHASVDGQGLPRGHTNGKETTAAVLEPMAKSPMRHITDGSRAKHTPLPQWSVGMSTDLNEYAEDIQKGKSRLTHGVKHMEQEMGETPMQNLNPWVIAKMNAPSCPEGGTMEGIAPSMPISSNRVLSPPTPDPPILRHLGGPPGDLDLPPNLRLHQVADKHHGGSAVPGGPYRSPMSSPLGATSQGLSRAPGQHNMILRHRRPQPPWTPPCSVSRPTIRGERQASSKSKLDRGRVGLEQTKISFNRAEGGADDHRKQEREFGNGRQPAQPHMNDSICAQDGFEAIFSTARQHFQQKVPQSSGPIDSIDRNKIRKPFRQLRSTSIQLNAQPTVADKEPVMTTIPTGDPRTYLLRRQKSICAEARNGDKPRFKRLKSSMLPLVNTPEEYQTHFLLSNSTWSVQKLHVLIQGVQNFDKYIIEGELEDAIDMDLSEGHRIESRLKALLSQYARDGADGANDVELDLSTLLKGKGRASGN